MSTDSCDEPIRPARYAEGRNLAVAMLRQGADLALSNRAALEARERSDPSQPQHRWVLSYLLELQRDPDLLDGFSAVLSDYLAAGSGGSPDHYAGVSVAMLTQLPDALR